MHELKLLILVDIVSSSWRPRFDVVELRVEFGWTGNYDYFRVSLPTVITQSSISIILPEACGRPVIHYSITDVRRFITRYADLNMENVKVDQHHCC
jgi:hypothetical protein